MLLFNECFSLGLWIEKDTNTPTRYNQWNQLWHFQGYTSAFLRHYNESKACWLLISVVALDLSNVLSFQRSLNHVKAQISSRGLLIRTPLCLQSVGHTFNVTALIEEKLNQDSSPVLSSMPQSWLSSGLGLGREAYKLASSIINQQLSLAVLHNSGRYGTWTFLVSVEQ